MTPQQYERWKDFAIRMARRGWPPGALRRPLPAWVEHMVEWWFDAYLPDDEIPSVTSWDGAPAYICDSVSEFIWNREPYFGINLDDYNEEDRRQELAREQWDEQWGGPVRCCIRAGLDMAAEPSAGVVGFNVGDLRRMYPEGLPEWLVQTFEPSKGRTIADASDATAVWL